MNLFSTGTTTVIFAKLPDEAVKQIGELHAMTGSRQEILAQLHAMIHSSTYAQLDPLIATSKLIAAQHNIPDAVVSHGT